MIGEDLKVNCWSERNFDLKRLVTRLWLSIRGLCTKHTSFRICVWHLVEWETDFVTSMNQCRIQSTRGGGVVSLLHTHFKILLCKSIAKILFKRKLILLLCMLYLQIGKSAMM